MIEIKIGTKYKINLNGGQETKHKALSNLRYPPPKNRIITQKKKIKEFNLSPLPFK